MLLVLLFEGCRGEVGGREQLGVKGSGFWGLPGLLTEFGAKSPKKPPLSAIASTARTSRVSDLGGLSNR